MRRRLPPMDSIKPILNEDGSIPALRHKPKVRLAWHEAMGSHCWVMLGVHGRHRGREVPAGHVVHHLCFEKRCVNPRHLELCTFGRNSQLSNFAERSVERAA